MISVLQEMLSYPFLVRAIVVGLLVSLCSSLLGVSLTLKKFSMIGDGLSHVGFGALAVSFAFNLAPLSVAIPACVIVAFLLLKMNESSSVSGDAAIALVSAGALAIGVMTVSLTSGMNTDVCNYMFGSILSLSKADARLSIALSVIVLVLFTVCYHPIFAITFDESFSKATGIKTGFYNSALAVCTSLTVVLGMRMMGALLISSLIIFPSMTSMRVFKKFKTVTISSAVVSLVCFIAGMMMSYQYELPTGAAIVCVNIVLLVVFAVIGFFIKHGKLMKKKVMLAGLVAPLLFFSCAKNNSTYYNDPSKENRSASEDTSVESAAVESDADSSEVEEEPEEEVDVSKLKIDVDMKDKLYVAYINDVYFNPDDYTGKIFRLQGAYSHYSYNFGKGDHTVDFVYRNGPGCCGNDGSMAGFEFLWKGELPKQDDWIEVIGRLEPYYEDNIEFLRLKAYAVTVMPERGELTVYN